jgi:hypothetical protein
MQTEKKKKRAWLEGVAWLAEVRDCETEVDFTIAEQKRERGLPTWWSVRA